MPISPPAWLLAGFAWLMDKLGNRAAAIAVASAGIAATITVSMSILTAYVLPHVAMPPSVYLVLSVIAPSDWAAQVGAMVGIKSLSMAHRASMYLMDKAAPK